MKVSNLTSPRTDAPVANQFVINDGDTEYFQSYNTMIAKNQGGVFTISSNWNYSVTTNKYFGQWMRSWGLGEELQQIKKWLKDAKDGDTWLGSSRYNLKYVEEI